MPTIQQLIREERSVAARKTKSPALKACPQRRGGLHPSVHDNAQKAQLSAAKSGSRSPHFRL